MVEFGYALEAIRNSESVQQLSEQMAQIIGGYGFTKFSYVDIRNIPIKNAPLPFFQTTLKEDFVVGYNSQHFMSYDPVLRRASITYQPFYWLECPEFKLDVKKPGVKSKARQIMEFAADFGFTDGYTIPVHTVDSLGYKSSGLITLYWQYQDRAEDIQYAPPPWLRFVALAFHERMLELRAQKNSDAASVPTLTDRERDCLLWACHGKTRDETAYILGITPRTVEFHFDNVMRKLKVHNKHHAVAVALHLGLIVL